MQCLNILKITDLIHKKTLYVDDIVFGEIISVKTYS